MLPKACRRRASIEATVTSTWAKYVGLDGVSNVRDQRKIVGPVIQGLDVMRIGALGIAAS